MLFQKCDMPVTTLNVRRNCLAPDGSRFIVNINNSPFFGISGTHEKKARIPLQLIDSRNGQNLGSVPVNAAAAYDTVPSCISPDNRWLLTMELSMSQGGVMAFGEMFSQIHKLPGGETLVRRSISPSGDHDIFGSFAETQSIAALLIDKSTVELWRLEPKAELLVRWQPYGGGKIADLGFTGDTLYLRGDGQTHLDLIPLAELNQRLKQLGLGW